MAGSKSDDFFAEEEGFLNERHLQIFRQRLMLWRDQLLREPANPNALLEADEERREIKLRAQERQAALLKKINYTLAGIPERGILLNIQTKVKSSDAPPEQKTSSQKETVKFPITLQEKKTIN